ncbi:MAG: NAD-dependent epimerase/dehydratase family protein [Desulfomonile tiedjei]|uniref:NAD-dependent epimerase/dehydratase family protein n=1 Tax=Desulfomonile tiedjei TaxID=2358 RepID=A0A9D6V0L1_9BACT|nr:NAD-dependent epimerase/dehydratase family protein [Desulfomonile tiedjei]
MAVVLLTGSAGFIGFYVTKALLESGDSVIGLDNFNSYYTPELKRARTAILTGYRNFVPVEADLADPDSVRRCFKEHSPDLVFHSAAQAGVRYSLRNPRAYQKSNLEGFINLIEEARLFSVKRFVYASSSSVYGGNTKMPYSEDDPVNSPVSLYAATKRANELIAHSYTHLWKLQTVGLRFFTVYGPWGRPDMAYWSFLEAILNREPIKVFNHGKNRRDFTYIDDIVAGAVAALKIDGLGSYEIINLGNNDPVELMDFIETLERFAGLKAVMEMAPPQPGDVVATYADIRKAQVKLGFQPKTSLKDGLEKFVKWYMDNRDLAEAVRRFRKG